jgi:hypothetical protein
MYCYFFKNSKVFVKISSRVYLYFELKLLSTYLATSYGSLDSGLPIPSCSLLNSSVFIDEIMEEMPLCPLS